MLTEKDYCDYDTCVALRELGFTLDMTEKVYERNLMTNRYETIPKPLLYEAHKWLREEKRICVEVDCCAGGYVWELCKAYQGNWFSGGTTIYTHYCEDNYNNALLNDCGKYNSYEDALLEGVRASIKILQDEQKEND